MLARDGWYGDQWDLEYGGLVRIRQFGDVDRHRAVVLYLGEWIWCCDNAEDDL